MFAVYLLSDPNGPPTAFLLFRPPMPKQDGIGDKAPTQSAALLHCCCTAEPVLTRATKQRVHVAKMQFDFRNFGLPHLFTVLCTIR